MAIHLREILGDKEQENKQKENKGLKNEQNMQENKLGNGKKWKINIVRHTYVLIIV